jgi:predicted Zn-dependent peptidase
VIRHAERSRPPALPAPRDARLPPFTRFRLRNGLEVAAAEQHALPLVLARLTMRAGAATDPPQLAGRASLTAELVDEGTSTRSALDIASSLEMLGADLMVTGDWDQTVLSLQVLADRLEPGLELLADILVNAAFDPGEVERKKTERLTALLQELDEPAALASRAFVAEVYGRDHAYGNAASGDLRTVRGIDRETLVRFHADRYRPADAFLVIVGDIEPARLVPTLERLFAPWVAAPVTPVVAPPPPPARTTAIRVVDRPDAPQSELRIGHAGPPRTTTDYFPIIVMNTILGGSFTSRLNQRLREEKGYTYGARSSFAFRAGPGPFVVSTAVDTRATAPAVSDVLREIRRLRDDNVPESELERARNYIALGLPRRFETVDGIAEHIAEILLYGLADDYYDHYMASVRAVGAEAVRSAAQRYLDPAHTAVVVAGDYDQTAGALEALGAGVVERAAPDFAMTSGTGTPLA